jgi:hypothetical protein
MPEARDFRNWAARVADRARKESDLGEAERLISIAEYWNRLAHIEDWERDARSWETRH